MSRIVLKVVEPRWCAPENRWLQPGELIILEEKDPEKMRKLLLLNKAKTVLHEGVVPKFTTSSPNFLTRVVNKMTAPKSGRWEDEGETHATFASFSAPPKKQTSEDDEKKAERAAKIKANICPTCGKQFKSAKGLKRHMKLSGHG